MSTKPNERWLIWSHEHNAWWRADSASYTSLVTDAGRYTFEEAVSISTNANYGLHFGKDRTHPFKREHNEPFEAICLAPEHNPIKP